MCGIVGIINFSKASVSHDLINKMVNAIKHRGPDGQGFYHDNGVAFGHCRLAIIDPSFAGHQPMLTADKRYAITYNGEIYNFKVLRKELESLGFHFYSNTDTEVVLNAYVAWGTDCVNRFNGMFAFAIWDKVDREIFIARDRYGMKPLYYTKQADMFLFASEQKALLSHPDVAKEVDTAGLLEYFTFQNFFTNKTLLKDIHLFPPGSWIKINTQDCNQNLFFIRFWDFNFQEPEQQRSEQDYLEELDFLFQQAVNRHLVSDFSIGAYLSGGMDSGSITAIASKQCPSMKTFTCGFDLSSASGLELAYDERKQAEHLSYLFKTEHYEIVLKAGDMERVLPALTYHLEEPRVGQSYPNYCVAQLASRFVKVVLSGTGGDELFGGYPWRYYRAVVNDNFEDYINKYYHFWQRLIPSESTRALFSPIWSDISQVDTRDIFSNVFPNKTVNSTFPEDYVNRSLYFEARTFLHGLLLVEDKLSMAHGLESRIPFLDNDLVDFAMRLPVKFKLQNLSEVVRLNENEHGSKSTKYYQRTRDGKLIFRKLMSNYIPTYVTQAEKQGFSAPDASWFKGESIDYVKRVIFNSRAKIYNYLDPKVTQALVTEHLSGKCNRRLLIWSLLNFDCWLNTFIS